MIKGRTSSNFLKSHVIGFDAILNRIILVKQCSLLICTKVNPSDWVKLFPVAVIGGDPPEAESWKDASPSIKKGRGLRLTGKL